MKLEYKGNASLRIVEAPGVFTEARNAASDHVRALDESVSEELCWLSSLCAVMQRVLALMSTDVPPAEES